MIKHNVVKAWQSEHDLITYYQLDEKECILRLSLPRYIVSIRERMGTIHMQILETLVLHGSLLKNEIVQILEQSYKE